MQSELEKFINNEKSKISQQRFQLNQKVSTKPHNTRIPYLINASSSNLQKSIEDNNRDLPSFFLNLRDSHSGRKKQMAQRNKEYNYFKQREEANFQNRFKNKKNNEQPESQLYTSFSNNPSSYNNYPSDKDTPVTIDVAYKRIQDLESEVNELNKINELNASHTDLPIDVETTYHHDTPVQHLSTAVSILPSGNRDEYFRRLKDERNKEYNAMLKRKESGVPREYFKPNDVHREAVNTSLSAKNLADLKPITETDKLQNNYATSSHVGYLTETENRLRRIEDEYEKVKSELHFGKFIDRRKIQPLIPPVAAVAPQQQIPPYTDNKTMPTHRSVQFASTQSIIPLDRVSTPDTRRRAKENYRKELEAQMQERRCKNRQTLDEVEGANVISLQRASVSNALHEGATGSAINETSTTYNTPADDAYYQSGTIDPLDITGSDINMLPIKHSPHTSFQHAINPRSVMSSPVKYVDQNTSSVQKSSKENYGNELQKQILEVRRRKEEQKRKEIEYDRAKDEEIARYNPFSRTVDRKDNSPHSQPTPMSNIHSKMQSEFTVNHQDMDDSQHESRHARGGHGIFGQPLTHEQKTAAERYKQDLAEQIASKRQVAEAEKKRELELEHRETKRLEQDQIRLKQEYEIELARKQAKSDEVRKANDEVRQNIGKHRNLESRLLVENCAATPTTEGDASSPTVKQPYESTMSVPSTDLVFPSAPPNVIDDHSSRKSKLYAQLRSGTKHENKDFRLQSPELLIGPRQRRLSSLHIGQQRPLSLFQQSPDTFQQCHKLPLSSNYNGNDHHQDFLTQLNALREQLSRERERLENTINDESHTDRGKLPEVFDPRLGELPPHSRTSDWDGNESVVADLSPFPRMDSKDWNAHGRLNAFDTALLGRSKAIHRPSVVSASAVLDLPVSMHGDEDTGRTARRASAGPAPPTTEGRHVPNAGQRRHSTMHDLETIRPGGVTHAPRDDDKDRQLADWYRRLNYLRNGDPASSGSTIDGGVHFLISNSEFLNLKEKAARRQKTPLGLDAFPTAARGGGANTRVDSDGQSSSVDYSLNLDELTRRNASRLRRLDRMGLDETSTAGDTASLYSTNTLRDQRGLVMAAETGEEDLGSPSGRAARLASIDNRDMVDPEAVLERFMQKHQTQAGRSDWKVTAPR